MNKEIQDKIRSCQALKGKSIADIVATQRFRDNLAAYMTAQREDRKAIRASYEAMRKAGGVKGFKIPSHVCEKVLNLSVEQFADEYLNVIAAVSSRPFAERIYVKQLAGQAYHLTVAQIVAEEFPELEEILIPKSNSN